jgi:hypothetical protein
MQVSRQHDAPAALFLGKEPRYPMDWSLDGPYNWSGCCGEQKIISCPCPDLKPDRLDMDSIENQRIRGIHIQTNGKQEADVTSLISLFKSKEITLETLFVFRSTKIEEKHRYINADFSSRSQDFLRT